MEFRLSDLALSAFPGAPAVEMLERDVHVFTDAGPCEPASGFLPAGTDRSGWQRYRARWRCDASTSPILRSDLFFKALPSHLHFARLQTDSRTGVDRVLTDGNREWRFWAADAGQPPDVDTGATSFFEYVGFGIKHIGTGIRPFGVRARATVACRLTARSSGAGNGVYIGAQRDFGDGGFRLGSSFRNRR